MGQVLGHQLEVAVGQQAAPIVKVLERTNVIQHDEAGLQKKVQLRLTCKLGAVNHRKVVSIGTHQLQPVDDAVAWQT